MTYDYSAVSSTEAIDNIIRFISNIWQIHPFAEGNTRTTAVFLIKYLRSFGFEVNNEGFERHSWFFRNALVRSQYENIPKKIHRSFEPLERFMNLTVFGLPADLRNRTLQVKWNEREAGNGALQELKRQNDVEDTAKRQNDVLKTSETLTGQLNSKEMAVVRLIEKDPIISIAQITVKTGLSRRTIDRIIAALKEKGLLTREGPRSNSKWILNPLTR